MTLALTRSEEKGLHKVKASLGYRGKLHQENKNLGLFISTKHGFVVPSQLLQRT